MSLWMCPACRRLQGFQESMRCPFCSGRLEMATIATNHPEARQEAQVSKQPPMTKDAAITALVEKWRDPEFWKDEGCRMDSQDCAQELADTLAALGGRDGTQGAALEKLRQKFDALLVREIQVFGGIPTHAGRTGQEQTELREAIAELLALQPAALGGTPETGWQPIATAPQQQKVMVSWVNALGKRRTTCAAFYPAGTLELDDAPDDMLTEEGTNAEDGWFECREAGDAVDWHLSKPLTHWQPLPSPPFSGAAMIIVVCVVVALLPLMVRLVGDLGLWLEAYMGWEEQP